MLLTDSMSIATQDTIQIVKIENEFAHAEISLFGGHILSYTPKHDGRNRLWVSENAIFDGKKAIRGGVPICWPWFGPHSTNQQVAAHGYVRTQKWQIIGSDESSAGTTIKLQPQTSSGEGFEGQAQLTLVVQIGQQLNIALHTTNIGTDTFSFNCALHSYFAINDIHQCELKGLSGQYSDKTRHQQVFDTPQPYHFNEETDRVHLQKPQVLSITDNTLKTQVSSSGHDSVVVWNPWQDKSISMGDMADNSYLTMLCVESAITQGKTLAPNETHILEQVVS